MYKLMVVAGPNRGTTYPIHDGENSIGRQSGNGIVLQSSKVSKRHCVLVVNNDGIQVQDQGSSNGTFVNGVLTKASRAIKAGDKISVGEYVLEVVAPSSAPRSVPAVAGLGAVLQFPPQQGKRVSSVHQNFPIPDGISSFPGAEHNDPLGAPSSHQAAPTDLKGRLLHGFESQVMPFFYGLTMKNEWRLVSVAVFAVFVLANSMISVYPLLDANRASVIGEIGRRARYIARQVAESNAPALAAKAETKTDIGIAENAENVRVAVLTDLDNRIIAPSSKTGQHLSSGPEARLAVRAAGMYRAGKENGIVSEMDESTLVAVEPVKVLSPVLGRNIVVGMVIISVDTTQSTLSAGDVGTIYSKTLILSALLALAVLAILYRMTMKPFQVLNEDMDKVLKGEMPQVTHEFKFEELNSLWDLINSSLQRIPKSNESSLGADGVSAADFIGPLQAFANAGNMALVVLDSERKIAFLNPLFEEVSGIRGDSSVGQEFSAVARDQAMGAMTNDLFDRVQAGTEGVVENFDFSGISYKVHAMGLGKQGEAPRCFVLAISKNNEGG